MVTSVNGCLQMQVLVQISQYVILSTCMYLDSGYGSANGESLETQGVEALAIDRRVEERLKYN